MVRKSLFNTTVGTGLRIQIDFYLRKKGREVKMESVVNVTIIPPKVIEERPSLSNSANNAGGRLT